MSTSERRAGRLLSTVGMIALVGMIMVAAVGISGAVYQRCRNAGPYRIAFAGKIIDKQTSFSQTELGASVIRRLLIEETDGTQTWVTVGEAAFEKAQPGMWLEKNRDTVKIRPSATPSTTP